MIETEDVRMMVDLGFVALSAGLDGYAETIFSGVEAARPEQEAGPLGLAMVNMARGELDAAIVRLKSFPRSDAALTYLGLALLRSGDRPAGQDILMGVVATAPGTAFAEVAAAALDAN